MDDLLSPKEAAAELGITPRTLRLWRAAGRISAVMVADRPRYLRSDVERVERPPMGAPAKSGKYRNWRKK
jgi:excisionase family DNA binding protein